MVGRTSIIIAKRLTTIKRADLQLLLKMAPLRKWAARPAAGTRRLVPPHVRKPEVDPGTYEGGGAMSVYDEELEQHYERFDGKKLVRMLSYLKPHRAKLTLDLKFCWW